MFYFRLLIFVLIAASCKMQNKLARIDKKELVTTADKIAEWQIRNLNYVSEGNLHDYGIDAWTNSVFYLGLMNWSEVTPVNERYAEWLNFKIGEVNSWQIPANFINYPHYWLYHADELCIGQFYEAYYQRYGTAKAIEALKHRLDTIMASPASEEMSYRSKQRWTWCDALFMAPPVYFGMTKITGNVAYVEYAHKEFMATYNHLFDKDENLFFRDDSYFDKREANGKKVFWGRGNGWVVAGVANILKLLPADSQLRPFYTNLLRTMLTRLVELQQADGFWHASLLDPESYPSPETSATSMITYALAYGINSGILDKNKFAGPLEKAWKSLLTAVDDDGKLGWVQPIGADPKKVDKEMTAVYGAGAFLLAASELYKMN